MPLLTRPSNLSFPSRIPQKYVNPKAPETYDYGFKRFVSILQSPPLSASVLAITLFYFIAFFSNILLAQASPTALGLTVTLGTFALLAMIVLILFVL